MVQYGWLLVIKYPLSVMTSLGVCSCVSREDAGIIGGWQVVMHAMYCNSGHLSVAVARRQAALLWLWMDRGARGLIMVYAQGDRKVW